MPSSTVTIPRRGTYLVTDDYLTTPARDVRATVAAARAAANRTWEGAAPLHSDMVVTCAVCLQPGRLSGVSDRGFLIVHPDRAFPCRAAR